MLKLENISVYLDLLPVLVVLLFSTRIKIIPIWVIFLYSLYSFINNQAIIYNYEHEKSIRHLLQYFTLFEYIAFAIVIFFIIRNKLSKYLLIALSVSFVIFCLVSIYYFRAIKSFDSLQSSIECIIIIGYCLFFLGEQIFNPQVEFIYSSYKFWLAVAQLIYLAGTFFVFAYAEDLKNDERNELWSIQFICNILKDLLFVIAIWLSLKPVKENPNMVM